ncbi:hypothetical protein GpartN1_g1052.t1 [Galdieria partita]|uniref:RNA helicase n=1 Tax=Galdieria partita TaxID=83374 RepID=A0A9C7PRU2_9RHOD|nr:hypothetical protein GpartN1_g1052.t1 [Galdieria partita]
MTREKVDGKHGNMLLQDLDRLNLTNQQLRFLRSSKTIGLGRKKPKKRTTNVPERKEENKYTNDSYFEEQTVIRPQPKERMSSWEDQQNANDFVFVNWNQLQWSTRKRKRNSETEKNPLDEQPSNQENFVSEASLEREDKEEAWKNSVRDVLEEKTPESLIQSEKERVLEMLRENDDNPQVVSLESLSEDRTSRQSDIEKKNNFVELGYGTTKPIIRRTKKEWKSRMQLPICEREQEIVDLVNERDIVFITSETGSGKTTQVPQFLYEAGFCYPNKDGYSGKIIITQPRRVGAFACSNRVAKELHVTLGNEVGYHVRHFRKISQETKIEFVTDGILLRLLQGDILLRQYSVVILDEAHERNIDTDLILGLVTRSVGIRRSMFDNHERVRISGHEKKVQLPPLKFIVMSATLDASVFISNAKLFPCSIPRPVTLQVETRGYPVHIHFAKKTAVNYVEAAFKTVCKIHRQLPAGDVLVFLTGRKEVLHLCRKLGTELQGSLRRKMFSHQGGNNKVSVQDVRILPLYSMLPWNKQQRIFSASKRECRTIVVATNVAETSITIPNIVYVVDSGRVKKKEYTSIQGQEAFSTIRFRVKWTSQSSAEQRAGRAGRVCEGHCYRLYSAAVFLNEMEEQEDPEILTTPAEALLLKLKAFEIDVHTFPFPSPPSEESLKKAQTVLCQLGALRMSSNEYVLTSLGKKLAKLPLSSRLGKLVVESCISVAMIGYAIRVAAILTVSDWFVSKEEEEEENGNEQEERTHWVSMIDSTSEILSILYSFCAWEYNIVQNAQPESPDKYGLRDKSVREISLIIQQISRLVMKLGWIPESWSCIFPSRLHPPNRKERSLLIRTILGCFPDQVCRHLSIAEATRLGLKGRRKREAFETVSGKTVFLSRDRMISQPVSSIEFLCYVELLDKSSSTRSVEDSHSSKHVYIRYCTVVTARMLLDKAPSMCTFSKPLLYPLPRYDIDRDSVVCSVHVSYGPRQWPLGIFQVPLDDDLYSQVSSGGDQYSWVMMDRYRIFGQSLLKGEVFEMLSQWTNYLKESPCVMTKAPSKPCVMQLYRELYQHKIYRSKDLLRIWEKRPQFLLKEYLNFLKDESCVIHNVCQHWPPVQRSDSISNHLRS